MPPPCSHRSFSAWTAQEKACVTSGPLKVELSSFVVGGLQVADVKASTSRRTKYLGNVPPRLETLLHMLASGNGDGNDN